MQTVLPNRNAKIIERAYSSILLLHKVKAGNTRDDVGKSNFVPVAGSNKVNKNMLNNTASNPAAISNRNLDKMAFVLERNTKIF